MLRHTTLVGPLTLVVALAPGVAAAQEGDWQVEGEVGGAVFFGNTSQTTFTTRLGTERADSAWEVGLDADFTYGESTDDEGADYVNKRSWKFGTSYNHRPFDRWSHFLTGEMESSLERRIEIRYNVGAGGKLGLVQSDLSRVDLSAALLAEGTNPADRDGEATPTELLARWSVRLRARRAFGGDERVALDTESQYRPELSEPSEFTFSSTSSLALRVNEVVSLKLTFVGNYDSGASERGAATNNDGRIFFSVLSAFR